MPGLKWQRRGSSTIPSAMPYIQSRRYRPDIRLITTRFVDQEIRQGIETERACWTRVGQIVLIEPDQIEAELKACVPF